MKLPIPFDNATTYPGHGGVDFPQPAGTLIPASGRGVVTAKGFTDRAGNHLWIRYEGLPEVLYAHLDSLAGVPAVGAHVSQGTPIGRVGSTGNSTGPHLHMEVRGYSTTSGFWHWFIRATVSSQTKEQSRWNRTARTTQAIQQVVGTTPDGIHGPQTDRSIREWQAANGLKVDGIWGPLSDAVAFPITVDGILGPQTVAKLQHVLGLHVDGIMGHRTIAGVQAAVGADTDGILGPQTLSLLQAKIGAGVDGKRGPDTWRSLQDYLNRGGVLR